MNPGSYVFRVASEADLPGIYRLEQLCFGQEAYPPSYLALLMKLPGVFLVAVLGGRVVGYVSALLRRRRVGHIVSICVDPEHRRRGLARRLMELAEDRLVSMGAAVFRLEVRASNAPAIRLYASLGYRPLLFLPRYYPGGEPALLMAKHPGNANRAEGRNSNVE